MGEPAKTEEPVTKIKIKMLRAAMVDGVMKVPGDVCDASPEAVKELCDHKFRGYIPMYGNKPALILEDGQPDPLARKAIVRAVRV